VTLPRRSDRIALLEMRALLHRIIDVRDDGGRERYFSDDRHRWVVHRLWIAVGNDAVAYAQAVGAAGRRARRAVHPSCVPPAASMS
jgi:hypothetical protein